MANDEAALNIHLADVLRPKSPRWRVDPHQLRVLSGGKQPDIVVRSTEGSPVILEAEYAPGAAVEQEARDRIGELVQPDSVRVENSIAIVAPAMLRDVASHKLAAELSEVDLEYCLYSSGGDSEDPVRWPTKGWLQGDVNYLANLVENAAISERLIASSLDILEKGVSEAAARLQDHISSGAVFGKTIAERLHQEESEQTLRMAMSIVANALAFQASLVALPGVAGFDEMRSISGRIVPVRVTNAWRHILADVNYLPIFSIALNIMSAIPAGPASNVLTLLTEVAEELVANGVASSHDLTGRMFQRLIADRKFLATFYTRPESATLLADLSIGMLGIDWGNPDKVLSLRIADLACGTGTLLGAAYGASRSRVRHSGIDDSTIHEQMLGSVLIGCDIMPAATHLTTSMLSSAHPTVYFDHTQVFTLPYGTYSPTRTSIGSLDLISEQFGRDLFGTGMELIRGTSSGNHTTAPTIAEDEFELPHSSLDLVVMNPPFTRPTNHKLAGVPVPSFAGFGTSSDEQEAMSSNLRRIKKDLSHRPAGNGNAGLATNFLDLAHVKLKSGGVLALVMPLSIVQGESWSASRALLSDHYRDKCVVAIATERDEDKSFSADTDMGEALILAKKRLEGEPKESQAVFVNLRQRPTSINDATQIARSIRAFQRRSDRVGGIRVGSLVSGCCIRGNLEDGGFAGVFDGDLALSAMRLQRGQLSVSGMGDPIEFKVARLGELGNRGPVDRDINGNSSNGKPRGPFDLREIEGVPTFPVLWAHRNCEERHMLVEPDMMGELRAGMDLKARKIWETASRVHISRGFRLNSQSLCACFTSRRSIGGRAWPGFQAHESGWEDAILLWLNSTLGLVSYWWVANKQQSGRADLTVTQIPNITCIDVNQLSREQLNLASECIKQFKGRQLLPAYEAFRDESRKQLDQMLLTDVLALPDSALEEVDLLRSKWCAEPSVRGVK